MDGPDMTFPREHRRPWPMQHGQASARPRGADDRRRLCKRLAARQGCPASALCPAPRLAAPRPCDPIAIMKNATRPTPAHSGQRRNHAAILGRFGRGWNTGTGLEQERRPDKHLILLTKSRAGTVEHWNSHIPLCVHARARARFCMFQCSSVPESNIYKCFQPFGEESQGVPPLFQCSTINNGGYNGRQA